MKKWKLVRLVLVVLLAVACGCGVPKAEVDELLADLEEECDGRLAKQRVQLQADFQKEFQEQLTSKKIDLETMYEERLAELEAENEYLRMPAPQVAVTVGIVGTVTFKELIALSAETFHGGGSIFRHTSAFFKGPYPLVSINTLHQFLEQDQTNVRPGPKINNYNLADELAYRLKNSWLQANLPGHSLSLIKTKGINARGDEILYWSNIFITKENGELVVYKVNPATDEVTRIEEPDPDTRVVIVADHL